MRWFVFATSMLIAPLALAAPAPRARATAPAPAPVPAPVPPPPVVQLAPIDLSAIPELCKPLAKQALDPRPGLRLATALSARIALATCMAERAVAPLELCDCGQSIVAIDAAAAPAIALLDDVIDKADPAQQVIAEHAQGKLYTGFAARVAATLPRVGADASEAERALAIMRTQALDAQLAPWREAALASFQHVMDAAKVHPEIAGNPQVASAVRDSERQLAASLTTS
jgi:hypothetical protein